MKGLIPMRTYSKMLVLAAFLASVSLFVTWLAIPKEQEFRYPMWVKVGDRTLIDPSPCLQFGSIRPGGCAAKYIRFRNLFLTPVRLSVSKGGEIDRWIYIDEPVCRVVPFLPKKIAVSVSIPENACLGEYKGEILVKARRY